MMNEKAQSRILLPNSVFMDAHGDTRIQEDMINSILSLTPEASSLIEAKFATSEKKKKKDLKVAVATAAEPTPPTPTPFIEMAIEVLRFEPRVATQKDWKGGTIGDKPVDLIPCGRRAGLQHKGHCGLAWEEDASGLRMDTLMEGGRGLTVVGAADSLLTYEVIPGLAAARTQKAKGLAALHAGQSGLSVAGFMLAQDWSQLVSVWRLLKGLSKAPIFVRACPVRPRHGFVDSRVIETEAQLRALHDETLAADPQGEWLLGEMIAAKANVIGTPQAISVGKGHDGATAGTDAITLPLSNPIGMRLCDMPEATRERAAIKDPEVPYVEVVVDDQKRAFLTQLRAGIAIPRSMDFIPERMRVTRVIRAEGSHLKWEEDMKALSGGRATAQGVVVDHFGGGTVSHYSLHAIGNGVPLLTSHSPKVGEILEPTAGAKEPYDLAALREGILSYYSEPGREIRKILQAAIYTFHMGAWLRGPSARLLGWSCACIHHAGTMAVAGETRHTYSHKKWDGPGEEKAVHKFIKPAVARSAIFDSIMKDPWETRDVLRRVVRIFRGTPWAGSYGGTLWDGCLKATIRLDDALHAVMAKEAAEPEVANLIGVTNLLLHLAHNNGWWLNKFVDQSIMDLPYWREDQGWLLPKLLSMVVPGMESMIQKGEGEGLKKAKKLWAEPTVPEDIRNLAPVWKHTTGTIRLLTPAKDLEGKGKIPVFLHVNWNFGKGLHVKWEMEKKTLRALGVKHQPDAYNLEIPSWMRGASKESRVALAALGINFSQIKIGEDLFLKDGSGVTIGEPIALTGFNNDQHESLLAEAMSLLPPTAEKEKGVGDDE